MKLILIRGLPGAGKSTFAKELQRTMSIAAFDDGDRTTCHHIEADQYFVKNGVYKFDAKRIFDAHAWCKQKVANALVMDENVIVSNTFSRIWEMQSYIDLAKPFGAELTVLTVEGNHGNVHGVPQHTIDRMKARWEKYDG